jgi:heterodisulfide reductase subunit A-like polyferredoxin
MTYSSLVNRVGNQATVNSSSKNGDHGLKILIVGAGIGGLSAAIGLRQQGHEVIVSIEVNSIHYLAKMGFLLDL